MREKKGMTQEALAKEAGVTRQTIISIENYRYTPSLPRALKFAKIFGRGVEEPFEV